MRRHSAALKIGAFELKDAGDDNPADIVTKALDELRGSIDQRITAVETKSADFAKLKEQMAKLEARLNRPGMDPKAANDNDGKLELKAFLDFCRHGAERLAADEIKALTVSTDTAGGFLAPESFASEILKALVQFSPIRQYARVVTVGASSVKYPRRTGSTAATWTDETADRTESEPAYEQVAITPYELATFTPVSNALLEDNAYNLESELASDFAESFGKAEGTAFVKGSGTGQPKGVMTAAGITTINTGVADNFPATDPADVIIGMFHALPNAHAQNGVWLMNRKTLGVVRTWKDGQGRYLVLDPISAGAPLTLLGRPIVEAIDMDDIGAAKFPVLFGDLSGYRIIDRVSLSVLRDPYSQATKGNVLFHARKRVGADITNPDRFVKLKCSV